MAPITVPGQTALAISRLGVGTSASGGNYEFSWGTQDGDTAPAYGLGRAEGLIGANLESVTTRPPIFTDLSRHWHKDEEQQLTRVDAATSNRTDALS